MPLTWRRFFSVLSLSLRWVLLLAYAAVLVYIVFFARRRAILVWSPALVNLVPLVRTIRAYRYINDIGPWHYWSNIFGNVLLFVPLAPLVAGVGRWRSRWQALAVGIALSVFIESVQYVLQIGVPDIDDVILNSTGALLGALLPARFLGQRPHSASYPT